MPMTSYERVKRTLARQLVDQVPVAVSPWGDTVKRWRAEGHLGPEERVDHHFGQDIASMWCINGCADIHFEHVILEETEETILKIDGNGATLRSHKLHDSTPEHVDFSVKDRESWEAKIKPFLLPTDRERINFESYRTEKANAAAREQFFCWAGVAPFEQMHPICGHEYMLMGMAEDPEWVLDMVMTYADFTIRHQELLFAEEGKPDGLFFYEDMGFKFRPFMSPAMYEEIIQPGHAKLFSYAHDLGCPVIVHSCGFVEPLVPGLIEAGMDCLQAMEVKAGMDLPELYKKYGDRIAFYGGIDTRALISNDRAQIDAEFENRVRPVLEGGGGYILHSDHSEPPEVDYETMTYFLEQGRAMSREIFAAKV